MEQDYDSRMEEQVEDLRDKMRLLQVDRKSNIDLLESSKQTNKDYIRQLKNENRDLRKALADLKRSTSSAAAGGGSQGLGSSSALGGGGGLADEAEEIASAMQHLNKVRKQHDDLRHRVQSQSTLLEELKDVVKDLELESKKPSLEDTPETRKIRMLENRLDKAMIKFNEAQSIRKTYEQIVKRLKDERIGFDNQLAAIERALAAKQHDYEELVLLSADASHARETILMELEKARSQHEDEKRHRDKELREKQQYVKIRLEMTNRLDKREKHKGAVVARESGDLNFEGESQLKASLMATMMQQGVAGEEKKEHRSKIDIFESAFRKIKEATGVSDVNEVIQKITSQESTTDNLLNLSKENQARLERLQAEHAVLKARVEELKYSGSGGGHRRKLVDDHEQNLVLASTKLERAKLKYERLAKVLIGVKAGVEHLVDKMESVREDDQVIVVTDETIVEALQESEITLTHLLSQIKLVGAAHSSATSLMDSSAMGQPKKLDGARAAMVRRPSLKTVTGSNLIPEGLGLDADILVARPYNQRIALPGTDGLTAEELEMDDTGGAGTNGAMLLDDTEEALSRDRVKRASSQVIMAQDKKKKRVLKKKFKESGNDSSDEEGGVGPGGSSANVLGSGSNQVDGSTRGPLTQRTLSPKKK
ncbi:Coiled-coil domain-containing protein [Phytophthora cinnamomi]|uniref:Coiled-coil domain-containing protein n=1 Tax=Phytophthora cinnamomi TaxID=4785 RepID=UPI0035597819|nr:Coiled-coil domain-containing protein [Phytophthora cinnamomi]